MTDESAITSNLSVGAAKRRALVDAGFSADELTQWEGDTRKSLSEAGFASQEIDGYFGEAQPATGGLRRFFETNLNKLFPKSPAGEPIEGVREPSITDAIEAGWQMSVSGLIKRGKNPDVLLPEDAPTWARVASQSAALAGDVPAMLPGAVGGLMAGATVGGPAAPVTGVIGAGAGAFAVPAGLRTGLMQAYESGGATSFKDYWERSSAVLLSALKGAATGATTVGAGVVVGKALQAAPVVAKTAAQLAAEVTTMVTVGRGLEGELPEPHDFLDAAILVGGLRGVVATAGQVPKIQAKLRNIYARTGTRPEEVARDARENPVIQQELLSDNIAIPRAYEVKSEGEIVGEARTLKPIVITPALEEQPAVFGGGRTDAGIRIVEQPPPQPRVPTVEDRIVPSSPPTYEQAVLDRIRPHQEPKMALSWNQLYTDLKDDLHPIRQFRNMLAGGEILAARDDPYIIARLTRGSYGRADQFLEYSPFKFDDPSQNVGRSLRSVLKEVEGDLDSFRAYAVSARVIEKEAQGVATGVPLDAARATVDAGRVRFDPTFRALNEYQDHLVAYLKDAGILNEKTVAEFKEANRNYVPFYRLMEEGEGGPGIAGRGLRVRNPIKKMVGSERPIVDPLESIVKNTYLYVTLAERNRALVKMAELAEAAPLGADLMQKVKPPVRPVKVAETEVSRFLTEHGIEGDAEAFTIFRPRMGTLAADEIALFRDGKREVYRVAPEVAEAVRNMDRGSLSVFEKLLAIPAKTLRAGAVLTPDFMARNMIRDAVSSAILPPRGAVPVYSFLQGLGSLLRKDENYQNWLKHGGANSAMVSIDRQYLEQRIFHLSQETGLLSKTWNVVKSPLEMLRVSSELIENATRLGVFARNKQTGDLFNAAFDSREGTLDFQRIGAKMQAANAMTAFLNVGLEGTDRTIRAFKDRPVATSARIMAYVTVPSVLLWWANHDDPRWNDIPRWQKDLSWIILTKDHIYRIPKPFELGILFGSLPERALEAYFTENPKAFKDFHESVLEGLMPNYIPTFALPLLEQFANRSTFTGNPIVPSHLEGILPEYQYTDYTTETGKMLGNLVARVPGMRDKSLSSPQVIENYIRAWSGGLGMYALRLADEALTRTGAVPDPVKPAATLADIPVVKAFVVRHPSASAQSIQDFYDRHDTQKKSVASIRHLAREGNFDAMQRELDLQQQEGAFVVLNGIRDALTAQTRFIHMVYKNPAMTPIEKRQIIDGVYNMMIQAARYGNTLMDAAGVK